MKYTVVYTDGRFYAYNTKGKYASYYLGQQPYKRSWLSVKLLHIALTSNPPMPGLHWVSYTEDTLSTRLPTTAASYKPAHDGYTWGTTAQAKRHVLISPVWPVIPERDDGSNEEPSTVPDALIDELSSASTKVAEDAKRTQKFWVDFYMARASESKSIGDDAGEQAYLRRAYAADYRHYMTFPSL